MSTEVAIPAEFRAIGELVNRLRIETQLPEDGFRVDIASIMENILTAESEEEVFARQEAGSVASKDYVNRPFFLDKNGLTWKASGAGYIEQGAFPFYALLRVTDMETGQDLTVNAGGASVVAVLDKLNQLGRLDEKRALMFVEKPVSSGFSVILLRPVATGNGKK